MDRISRQEIERNLRAIPAVDPGDVRSLADWIWRDILAFEGRAEAPLQPESRSRLEDALRRLATGEPIQYIAGHAYFFGYRFRVDPSTLIPRPETEELVAWALEILRQAGPGPWRILDVGTGSGCIAITLALKLGDKARVAGLDISGKALAIARDNALRPGATVEWIAGDFLGPLPASLGPFDLVISNPPYIDPARVGPEVMDKLRHEPYNALVAPGEDPDIFYRELSRKGKVLLPPGCGWLLAEINEFRADEIRAIFEAAGWGRVEVRRDLSGHPRMLWASN